MLNIAITPHREFLPADAAEQKLFVMLKLRPTKAVSNIPPATAFVFVIDTSGSMYEGILGESQPTGRNFQTDGNEYLKLSSIFLPYVKQIRHRSNGMRV
ncbi:MAG: hypothetical protein F6K47_22370 [Symploca sp. SIO2E6]|nr:hypothetical protein [Symploca sp. SIO2E6]